MADDVRVSINPDDYTLNEWIEFEDLTGVPVQSLGPTTINATVIRALVFITLRRGNPNMTIEEAGLMKPAVIDWPDANPTEPARLEAMPATGRKRAS